MKTLRDILESLLDADFDIDVDDVTTFGERGYICTKCNYSTQLPLILLSDRLDARCKQAGAGEDSFKVGFDKMIKDTHQKYAYKFKYYRNNILFSAEWANGAKVSMKFVPQ